MKKSIPLGAMLAVIFLSIIFSYLGYFFIADIYKKLYETIPKISFLKVLIPTLMCTYIWVGATLTFIFRIFTDEEKSVLPLLASLVGVILFIVANLVLGAVTWIFGNMSLIQIVRASSVIGYIFFFLAMITVFFMKDPKTAAKEMGVIKEA